VQLQHYALFEDGLRGPALVDLGIPRGPGAFARSRVRDWEAIGLSSARIALCRPNSASLLLKTYPARGTEGLV
jgi:hypothetical protein